MRHSQNYNSINHSVNKIYIKQHRQTISGTRRTFLFLFLCFSSIFWSDSSVSAWSDLVEVIFYDDNNLVPKIKSILNTHSTYIIIQPLCMFKYINII